MIGARDRSRRDFYWRGTFSLWRFILLRVYVRPEKKSTQNKISIHHQRNYVHINFYCRRNERNFVSGVAQEKISPRADVSFYMISFRVVFTWYFTIWNEISFLSKWPLWNNSRNEIHFGLYHVSSYKKLTRHWNDYISFCPKWDLMLVSSIDRNG